MNEERLKRDEVRSKEEFFKSKVESQNSTNLN